MHTIARLRNSIKSLLGEFWSFKIHAFWKNQSFLSTLGWETALQSNVQETTTSPLSFFFFLILKLQIGLSCLNFFYRYNIKIFIYYATYSRKLFRTDLFPDCVGVSEWQKISILVHSFGFMFACFLMVCVYVCVCIWGISVYHLYLAPVMIFSKCLLSNKPFCVFF